MATMTGKKAVSTATKAVQIASACGNFQDVERFGPIPTIGPVRINVQACRIYRPDMLTKDGRWPGPQYPRVPEHEIADIIGSVKVRVGWLGSRDGSCLSCRRENFNQQERSDPGYHLRGRLSAIHGGAGAAPRCCSAKSRRRVVLTMGEAQ